MADAAKPLVPAAASARRKATAVSAGAAQAALGQVVVADRGPGASGVDSDETVLGPHGGQHRQVALDFAPDTARADADVPTAVSFCPPTSALERRPTR